MNKLSSYLIVCFTLKVSKSPDKILWELSTCLSIRRRMGRVTEILVFYFIGNEMVVTQNFRLIRLRFLEEIIAGLSKHKDGKNILEHPSNIVSNPGALGCEWSSTKSECFVTPLLCCLWYFSAKILTQIHIINELNQITVIKGNINIH